MIKVESLSKVIHGHDVLKNISFTVNEGSVTGIIGRNGVGKTTLLRMMVGILQPDEGQVLLNGDSVIANPRARENIIYVPDAVDALKHYSTDEIAKLYRLIYPTFDVEYFQQLMERFNLNKTKKIKHYSKGMRALFSLVLAFSTKASYLLLDEPTDGLDVIVKKKMLRFILEEVADRQVGVVIASHRLDELEHLADQILIMKNGTIAAQYDLDSIKSDYKKVQVVFSGYMPADLEKDVHIIEQTGRVYVVLLEGDIEKAEEDILVRGPILYEELPLTLEDVFVATLGGDEIVS